MSPALIAAVVSGCLALVVASFTLWVTQSPIARALREAREKLEECERDRGRLRRDLQLVVSAIVGMLPAGKRQQLLRLLEQNVGVDEAA